MKTVIGKSQELLAMTISLNPLICCYEAKRNLTKMG